MSRLVNPAINLGLVATAVTCLSLAWRTGFWTAGAAGAFAALCLVGLRLGRRAAPKAPVETEATPRPAAAPRRTREVSGDTLVEQMLSQGREALLLRPQIAANLSPDDVALAQAALDEAMSIVPDGPVIMRARCHEDLEDADVSRGERLIEVEGFFLDRWLVTNADYQRFVDDGGYEQMSLWDESIWSAVLGFTDKTGHPGPRFWHDGHFPDGLADHPVVGVSWFEAGAYSRWVGKRLPTDPEWVKAGSWPVAAEGARPIQRKFPWGEAMDRGLVQLWGTGQNGTTAVTATPGSASVGGVQQLVGNVWEWTSTNFGIWEPAGRKIETSLPLKSIRGGAYDTYFDSQANCQFQSGESPLSRKHNIGFRCGLGFCDVIQAGAAGDENEESNSSLLPAHEETHA
ncbi:MAG: SUMF1/EgtB/PvdO family nonheme iron enzyme [Pirellulaceae bacterium]|nr:SUMF1/EgtB/PvdO family nonheme iron enzyme [Pirellulaceae bacterium]